MNEYEELQAIEPTQGPTYARVKISPITVREEYHSIDDSISAGYIWRSPTTNEKFITTYESLPHCPRKIIAKGSKIAYDKLEYIIKNGWYFEEKFDCYICAYCGLRISEEGRRLWTGPCPCLLKSREIASMFQR